MPHFLNITEGSILALHAARLLARNPGKPIPTQEAARTLNASAAHLSKVLQRMVRAGILRPVRGPRGGYLLNRPSRMIRLGQIFEAIEGQFEPSGCLMERQKCLMGRCMFGRLLDSVNRQVSMKFQTPLSEL